jgi:uncharacterized protein (TIGR00730 family)
MSTIASVCVYCGSGSGNDAVYHAAATSLGQQIGQSGMRLVYGGGSGGLMGATADATLASGGTVLGIIPQFLVDRERAHTGLSELVITKDMHERKWAMFENADAFVALPGGIGTLEELIEILTWAQLGRHRKPIIIANINGFWDHLATLFEHMDTAGFIHSLDQFMPIFVDSAEAILPAVLAAAATAKGVPSANPEEIAV